MLCSHNDASIKNMHIYKASTFALFLTLIKKFTRFTHYMYRMKTTSNKLITNIL